MTDASKLPKIFSVNWFRKDADGEYIWPGYGENSRVLDWIVRRISGDVDAVESPVGMLPVAGGINTTGLDVAPGVMEELFTVDAASWLAECDLTETYFEEFGDHVPDALREELAALRARLSK
jgi:phosphoenolpyruvate carboxykinase (GTP)